MHLPPMCVPPLPYHIAQHGAQVCGIPCLFTLPPLRTCQAALATATPPCPIPPIQMWPQHNPLPPRPAPPLLSLQFPADLEEQVCRALHHSMARVEELVNSIYDTLRPAPAAEAPDAAAAAGAAQADQQQQQPSPFGSKENKPQQGAAAAAAAADKPGGGGAELATDADSGAAGAGGRAEPTTAKKAEGGSAAASAAAGGEQRGGRKPKTPKAPASRSLLRTYIVEVRGQARPGRSGLAWLGRPAGMQGQSCYSGAAVARW